MPKLTKGIITRDEAFKLAPDYVKMVESNYGDTFHDFWEKVHDAMSKLKKGQAVITHHRESNQYLKAKVTMVDNKSYQAVDGPVIRVSNGEYSWRCDGSENCYPA